MSKTNSKTKQPNSEPRKTLKVAAEPGTDSAVTMVKVALRPTVRAAVTTQRFAAPDWGELDLTALADELSAQVGAVTGGDLARAEAMLVSQAHVLETLFHELARRSGLNMGQHLPAAETYMRLALRAQSQCRATLETLATIKNPPASVAFVRQANIAHGPQQVNNGPPAPVATSRAREESEKSPNELLEVSSGNRLDLGTPTQTSGADPHVEAVGAIDRTPDAGGQGARCRQCV
jgi:hypothetical protein